MDERLPWHDEPWRRLSQCRAAGRLPHALLLAGPGGLGKRVLARRLSEALLCADATPDGDTCGRCRGCRLFRAGSHPDFCAVRPAEEGKAIRVDQIRELRDFLGLTAQYGGYKIALLEPADRLNLNAANSLLKTLEEPPGDSLLLLVADQPARLPATVRSRCQVIRFTLPPAEGVLSWLAARTTGGLEPRELLAAAGGAPLAALAFADEDRWSRRRALVESYGRVLDGKADPVREAERWLQGDLAESLRWLIGWHTDLIRLKMASEPPRLGNPDLRATLRCWADRLPPKALFERLDAAIRLHFLCSTTQANAQQSLEAFLGDSAISGEFDVSRTSVTKG